MVSLNISRPTNTFMEIGNIDSPKALNSQDFLGDVDWIELKAHKVGDQDINALRQRGALRALYCLDTEAGPRRTERIVNAASTCDAVLLNVEHDLRAYPKKPICCNRLIVCLPSLAA